MSSQDNIDRIILDIFGKTGVFCEAGGAHPIVQNNTYLLEQNGWSGLVIEPYVGYNDEYRNIRPNTTIENFVLVSNKYSKNTIEATISNDFGGSVIEGAHGNVWRPELFNAITLDKVLKKNNLTEIHFLSLDVEGYEHEVIEGINFDDVFIHCIVPEIHWKGGFEYLENFGFTKFLSVGNHEFYMNQKSNFYEKIIKYKK